MDQRTEGPQPTRSLIGPPQHEFVRRLARAKPPSTYLEIGLSETSALPDIACTSIGVDPRPVFEGDPLGSKPALHLFRSAADDFFRDHDPRTLLGAPLDLVVIGAEGRFEFLLRHFIAIEKAAGPDTLVVVIGTHPTNADMAEREHSPAERKDKETAHLWAGERWKLIELLREHRPDLRLIPVDASPTGLVVVAGLNPDSQVLADAYPLLLLKAIGEIPTDARLADFWRTNTPLTSTAAFGALGLSEPEPSRPPLPPELQVLAKLARDPKNWLAQFDLAAGLSRAGRKEEAVEAYRRAIEIKPDYIAAMVNLAILLMDGDRPDEADACLKRALGVDPTVPEVYFNLASLAEKSGNLELAVARYRRAIELRPTYVKALHHLANVLVDGSKLAEATDSFRRALEITPTNGALWLSLGATLLRRMDFEGAEAACRKAVELLPYPANAFSNLLFSREHIFELGKEERLAEALKYGEFVRSRVEKKYDTWRCDPNPGRLRVGIVSGDLWDHVAGVYLMSFLENHDPKRVELYAYPTTTRETSLTAQMKARFSKWTSLYGKNDETAARTLHEDGLHVLIDLSGHTGGNRLPVFGFKPAPVQASWIGYFATTGVAEMDYFMVEPNLVPPEDDDQFVEKPWRVAGAGCLYPPQLNLWPNELPALSSGVFTFGCFNSHRKVNDHVIAVWARILREAPGSRLFLKAHELGEESAQQGMRARFKALGVDEDRLDLEGASPRPDYLRAYHRVDVALDPFPHPGATTSLEGVWMGVPVITRRGDRLLSRIGEHVMGTLDMHDWIASSEEEYVAMALACAADPARLAPIRAGLRERVLASPLFDGKAAAVNVQEALWGMWRKWQETNRGHAVEQPPAQA